MPVKCDMTGRMSGYFHYPEIEIKQWQVDGFTIAETLILARNSRVVRTKDLGAPGARQFGDTSDVVRVVVRYQDIVKLQAVLLEYLCNRAGSAGINDRTMFPTS